MHYDLSPAQVNRSAKRSEYLGLKDSLLANVFWPTLNYLNYSGMPSCFLGSSADSPRPQYVQPRSVPDTFPNFHPLPPDILRGNLRCLFFCRYARGEFSTASFDFHGNVCSPDKVGIIAAGCQRHAALFFSL